MTGRFRTVVVVDDDFAVTALHSRFIDSDPRFRTVARAHSGVAALEAVRHERPHLVLLDVYLPDLSGIDVVRQLRAGGDDVEVIAVTAARDLETIRQASQLDVRHYLVKLFPERRPERAARQRHPVAHVPAAWARGTRPGHHRQTHRHHRVFCGGGTAQRVSARRPCTSSSLPCDRIPATSPQARSRNASACRA